MKLFSKKDNNYSNLLLGVSLIVALVAVSTGCTPKDSFEHKEPVTISYNNATITTPNQLIQGEESSFYINPKAEVE